MSPLEAQKSFWVPSLCKRGMLLSTGGKFYLCSGSNPAVSYVTWFEGFLNQSAKGRKELAHACSPRKTIYP